MRRTAKIFIATAVALVALSVEIDITAAGAPASQSKASTHFHPSGIVPFHKGEVSKVADRASSNSLCSYCAPPLIYNGGTAMGGETATPGAASLTPVFWAPAGYSFPSGYQPLIEQYLADVAAASGSTGVWGSATKGNDYSVAEEYFQQSGSSSQYFTYRITAGAVIADADAYPTESFRNGCLADAGYSACVDDSALQTELSHLLSSRGLTGDDSHLYLILFPPGVETCISNGSTLNGDQCSTNTYCGYHNAFSYGTGGDGVYANLPFPDLAGCGNPWPNGVQAPNGNAEGDVEVSIISHETIESITDWAGNAWFDSGGNEIADECLDVFGNALGSTSVNPGVGASGSEYNQVINGHYYYTQDEFSNGAYAANAGDPAADGEPTVTGCVPRDYAPTITDTTAPSATTGGYYSFNIGADGMPAPSVSLTAGSLPAGLSVSSSGVISGTPSCAGASTFTLAASNHVGSPAAQTYTVTVDGTSCSATTTTTTTAPSTTTTTAPGPSPAHTCPTGRSGDVLSGAVVGIAWTEVGGCQGYWVTDSSGQVEAFGAATFHGDLYGIPLAAPVISMTATGDGDGYWLLGSDGGVFTFGDATFYGSTGGMHLAAPVVSMAVDPATGGYWMVAQDGGIFAFHAPFFGSTGGTPLNKPVDGMAVAPGGDGYWLVAQDGGVFAFTPDGFYGSMGGSHLNKPVVGMSSTSDGGGYTLVASDGGVFNFGDSRFYGSLGANPPSTPVVDLSPAAGNGGYLLVDAAGQVFAFGDAEYFGNA